MKNSAETEFVSILGANEKSGLPGRVSSRSLPDMLPILGLSDIVIFPGAVVPLLVETGPSLKLIDELVAGDRLFGAILQIHLVKLHKLNLLSLLSSHDEVSC